MRKKHHAIFAQLTAMFAPHTIRKWEKKVLEWHADTARPRTKPNPYEELRACG